MAHRTATPRSRLRSERGLKVGGVSVSNSPRGATAHAPGVDGGCRMGLPSQPMGEAHDVWHGRSRPLDALFEPRSVAVIGASEKAGSVGRTLLWNLISSPFGGTVFPVNPKRSSVLGIKAYPSMADVPESVDLAVIATPAPTVPGLIGECVAAGVPAAI